MTTFSAGPQSLGYLYQVRFALARLLRASVDNDLYLEGLDDITFEENGTPLELIQTKHHCEPANLTDSSADLWKTIRVWSHRFKANEIDISLVNLSLVTNGTVAKDTIAYYLGPDKSTRSVEKAIEIMDTIAVRSKNQNLEAAISSYASLDKEEKKQLLSAITIITCSKNIIEIGKDIEASIRYAVPSAHVTEFVERLEGWWFSRAISALKNSKMISGKELTAQVHSLRQEYLQESLPIHDFLETLPAAEAIQDTDRGFVDQLNLIKVGTGRLTKAISDYYRAFTQRSKWLRDGHLHVGEINKYEQRLVDEWERIFEAMKDEIPGNCDGNYLEKVGREIFTRIDTSFQLHIRPRATDPFIMRGSYHILSNAGRVGWHPEFEERLKHLFKKAMESSLERNAE